MTDLLLYLTSTNDGIARELSGTRPSSEQVSGTRVGTSLGYGEIVSQGTTNVWPAASSAPAPSGKGFFLDDTILEAQRFDPALWRASIRLTGIATADLYVRIYKLSSSGAYELIATCFAPVVDISGTPTTVVLPAGIGLLADFVAGDKLYLDVIANIRTNPSGDVNAVINLYTNGGVAEQLQTPGYEPTPLLPADTVLDLIVDSLVALTAIQQGDEMSDEDANVGFRALNFIIDRANADRLLLNAIADKTYPMRAHLGVYTIGRSTLADFNEPRPVEIQSASIMLLGLRHELKLNTSSEWAALREKSNEAQVPTDLYCDYRWPVARLQFNPIPLCVDSTVLEMFFWAPLPKFTSLSDVVDLPPAYYNFLKFALALELALPFMKQPSQLLLEFALNSKADVRAFNAQQMGIPLATGTAPQVTTPAQAPPQ